MHSRTICALVVLLLARWSTAAPFTMEHAAAAALANQPLLAGQQAGVDAAEQRVVSEGQLPDPKLKLGLQNVPTNNFSLTEDFMTMRAVAVEQAFPAAAKRKLRGERAKVEADVGRAELDNLKRTIRRDAKLAWLGVYYPVAASALVKSGLQYYEQQRDALEIALRAGKARLADVTRMQVEIDLQKDRLAELEGQIARARAELARWVGREANRELPEVLPEQPIRLSMRELRAGIDHHPENAAALGEIELAKNEVAQARAAYQSDWSLEVAYSRRGPAFADMVSVQVGMDLPIFTANRQDRGVAAKEALRSRAENMHADHVRRLAAELEATYADWQSARQRLERFDRDVLPQAAHRVEAVLAAYRGAQGELMNVIEARRAEVELRLQRLQLSVALQKSQVQLGYFAE